MVVISDWGFASQQIKALKMMKKTAYIKEMRHKHNFLLIDSNLSFVAVKNLGCCFSTMSEFLVSMVTFHYVFLHEAVNRQKDILCVLEAQQHIPGTGRMEDTVNAGNCSF